MTPPPEPRTDPLDVQALVEAIDQFITSHDGFDVDDAEAIAAIYARLAATPAPETPTERFTNQYLGTFPPAPAPLDVLVVHRLLCQTPGYAGHDNDATAWPCEVFASEYMRLVSGAEVDNPYDVLYPHVASQAALCRRIHPAMTHPHWQAMADRAAGRLPRYAKPGNGPGGVNEARAAATEDTDAL